MMIKEPKAGFLCSHFTLTSFTIGNYRENLNELCKKSDRAKSSAHPVPKYPLPVPFKKYAVNI